MHQKKKKYLTGAVILVITASVIWHKFSSENITKIETIPAEQNQPQQSRITPKNLTVQNEKPAQPEIEPDSQTDESKNPLSVALQNGRPTIMKIGSNSCVPCRMMKPILAELQAEYGDIANILDLEARDHRDLCRQYKIRLIPTSIFFDQNGKQYSRQEGFLEKAKIIELLKAGGMN